MPAKISLNLSLLKATSMTQVDMEEQYAGIFPSVGKPHWKNGFSQT